MLLTGEAGAGKSTLARKLAYSWARGAHFREVLIVYMLLVCELKSSYYDDKGCCFRKRNLATAVVCKHFPQALEDKIMFVRLRKLVE